MQPSNYNSNHQTNNHEKGGSNFSQRNRRSGSSHSQSTPVRGGSANVTRTNACSGTPLSTQRRQMTRSPPNLAPMSSRTTTGSAGQEQRDKYYLNASNRFPKTQESATNNARRRRPVNVAHRRPTNRRRNSGNDNSRADAEEHESSGLVMTSATMRAMSSIDPKRIERYQQEVYSNSPCLSANRGSSCFINDVSHGRGMDQELADGEGIRQPEAIKPPPLTGIGEQRHGQNVEGSSGAANAQRTLAESISEWKHQHSLDTSDVATILWNEALRWSGESKFDSFLAELNASFESSMEDNCRRMSLASESSKKVREISNDDDPLVEVSKDSDPDTPALRSDHCDSTSIAAAISDSFGEEDTPDTERSLHGGAQAPIKELDGDDDNDSEFTIDTLDATLDESGDFDTDRNRWSSLEPSVRYRLYPADTVKGLIYSDDNVTQPRTEIICSQKGEADSHPSKSRFPDKIRNKSTPAKHKSRGSSRGTNKTKSGNSLAQNSKRSLVTAGSKSSKTNTQQLKKKCRDTPEETSGNRSVNPVRRVPKKQTGTRKKQTFPFNSSRDNHSLRIEDIPVIGVDEDDTDTLPGGRKDPLSPERDGRTLEHMHSVDYRSDILSTCPSEISNKCSLSSCHRVEAKRANPVKSDVSSTVDDSPCPSVDLGSSRSRSSAFSRQKDKCHGQESAVIMGIEQVTS